MKYTKILFISFFFLLILPFVFLKTAYGNTYFNDNFKSGSLNKWTQNTGNIGDTTSWFIQNDVLHGRVSSHGFSYLFANTNDLPQNYTLTAKVKNISGVDQQFVFRVSNDEKEYYLVDYRYNDPDWSQDNNNIKVYKVYRDHYITLGVYPSELIPRSFEISRNVNHEIKVTIEDNSIKAFFDNTLAVNVGDTVGDQIFIGDKVGLMTWGGDLNYVSENTFESVYIGDGLPDTPKNKIIILPGLGASWNTEAILLGNTAPSFEWTMTPFVKNYNLLFDALEKNGLVRNKDFYVWNYDWRKPLNQIVNDFNNYVATLNLESDQKVDLVGHSLGGLVARLWTQDHQNIVNQTMTLGSPHFGSVKAYEAWNGVKISDSVDVASIALNVLLQLQKKNNDSLVQTLRNYAPIVFDLSPTFNFLKKNGNQIEAEKSQYLVDKNNVLSSSIDKLNTIDGIGIKTKEWINLSESSVFDKVLGIWKEGRPLSYVYGDGDGTVLKKSALITGTQTTEYDSNHGELVDKSTNLVLLKLGLGTTVTIASDYPQKEAVFYLGSPATMVVKCGGVEKSDVDGWIIFENQELKNCQVKLTGKDQGGTFHLVVGDDKNWQYFEGNIKKDQVIKLLENQTKDSWQVLRDDFEKIGAKFALKSAKKENIMETVDAYMLFRFTKENFKYSEEILDNLKIILSKRKVGVMENNMTYYLAEWKKELVEKRMELLKKKNISPSYAAALNYKQANDLLKPGLNYAQNLLAQRLFLIVWK